MKSADETNDRHEPTEDGRRRYPRAGGYYVFSESERIPCQCNATCPRGCDGRCGCAACSLSLVVWADESGLFSESLALSESPLHERPDYPTILERYGRFFPSRPQDEPDEV